MTAEELAPLPDEDTLRLMRAATYLFVLLLPLAVLFVLSSTSTRGALSLHTRRGFYLSDLPLAAILVLALTTTFKWRRGPLVITLPLLALTVLAFLAIPRALSPSFAFYVALRWLVAFLVYLWFLQPLVPAKPLLAVFVAGITLYGLLYVGGFVLNNGAPLLAGDSLPPTAPAMAQGIGWLQTRGILPASDLLAGFLAVAFLLNVSLIIYWPAIVAWWILGVSLLAALSLEAGAAVFAVSVPLLAWHYRRRRRHRPRIAMAVAGLIATLFIAGLLLNGPLAARLGPAWSYFWDGADVSGDVRLGRLSLREWAEMNEVAWRVIGEQPVLGAGPGNFPHAMLRVDTTARVQDVQNVPLLLAAELGIGGGLLWLFIWLAAAVAMLRRLRTRSAWLLAALSAWLVLGFMALFNSYPWGLNQGQLLTATVLGLVGRGLSRRR